MKKNTLVIIILVFLCGLSFIILKSSYAFEDKEENTPLNKEELVLKLSNNTKEELYRQIDLIDNSLIPTATFDMSNV